MATRLRDEVLRGRISPGQKIIEGRWARQFGIAQLSIREALNILAVEGFVTKRHGRSARVLSLTETDIIHIYQIRGALEGLAARIIAERKLPLQDIEFAMSAIHWLSQAIPAQGGGLSAEISPLYIGETWKSTSSRDWQSADPLLAITRMRVQAKNLDASPWVPKVSNHQRILDALRLGDHIWPNRPWFTSRASFSRQVWPSGQTKSKDNEQQRDC